MGIVVRLPRHARGSARAARASKVMCPQAFDSANRTISGHRLAGMNPRARQVLTVEGGKCSSAESAPVPPKSSIAESTVTDITPYIVRNPRTCQGFATRETTFSRDCASIGAMKGPLYDPPEVIKERLRAIREALGYAKQADFAEGWGSQKTPTIRLKRVLGP